MAGLTDYQRGYRDAQRRALDLMDQERDIASAERQQRIELAQPVPGCGATFQTPADGEEHHCTEHRPDLYYTHSDGGRAAWRDDGRYQDDVNMVTG